MQVATIGLDLAKHVFQIHGIDAAEKVVIRRQLRRSQVKAFFEALATCLIGMEACATSHYWSASWHTAARPRNVSAHRRGRGSADAIFTYQRQGPEKSRV